MSHEKALALSRDLVEDGFAHTISVGIHDKFNPPVQARVDIRWPLRTPHEFTEAVEILDTIARRHDLRLDTDMLGKGITFSSERVSA